MTVRTLWVQDLEGTAEQLNFAAFWKASDIAGLKSISSLDLFNFASSGFIVCAVNGFGYYRFEPNSSATPDSEIVVLPNDLTDSDNGRWHLEAISIDLIFAYFEPRFAEIEARLTAGSL